MNLETQLRQTLETQAEFAPEARGLADRAITGAVRARRTRLVTVTALVAVTAVAIPIAATHGGSAQTPVADNAQSLIAGPSAASSTSTTAGTTTPASSGNSTTPSSSASDGAPVAFQVLPEGPRTTLTFLIGGKLITRVEGSLPTLPKFDDYQAELMTTSAGTVLRVRTETNASAYSIYLVRADGTVEGLVRGEVLGMATDGARLAFSRRTPEGEGRFDLFVLDLATKSIVKELRTSPKVTWPVAFSGDRVLMSDGLGPEKSVSVWNLVTNAQEELYEQAGQDFPLDAAGDVALIVNADTGCISVWEMSAARQRSESCDDGQSDAFRDRFGVLSPDGRRFAGGRNHEDDLVTGLAEPPVVREWPLIVDAATGQADDRLRRVFRNAALRIDTKLGGQLAWEDSTHLMVVAISGKDQKLLLRCDVVAATCEITHDTGTPGAPGVMFARPLHQ